tara:strand:- start:13320 stop:13532 length:213 start_codon:yes stop_codon:yes gene_type:complete
MIWVWLKFFRFFNKIGNYFYLLHVNALHLKLRKEKEMPKKAEMSKRKSKTTVSAKPYSNMKKSYPKKKKK